MSEYTPTTEAIQRMCSVAYAYHLDENAPDISEEDTPEGPFVRWLAQHDREVAAKTLRDATQDIYLPSGGPSTYVDIDYAEHLASQYLKDRAEQIEKGLGNE